MGDQGMGDKLKGLAKEAVGEVTGDEKAVWWDRAVEASLRAVIATVPSTPKATNTVTATPNRRLAATPVTTPTASASGNTIFRFMVI
jgi:hypothetical protein